MKLGLIAHTEKDGASQLLRRVIEELRSRSISFLMEQSTANLIGEISTLPSNDSSLAQHCDLLLVMGGDGTILRALHRSGGHIRPIFGINIGSLGFLTCLGSDDYLHAINSILNASYLLSHRSLLDVAIEGDSGVIPLERALNDMTISHGKRSQLVKLQVNVSGIPLTEYHADGLIVATPTGSTAYSLAAGGPILMPDSRAILITPICPHVLSNRSLVLSEESEIFIKTAGSQEVFVTIDGRTPHTLQPNERIILRLSLKTLPLAMMPGTTFPDILRQKLKWSGSNL